MLYIWTFSECSVAREMLKQNLAWLSKRRLHLIRRVYYERNTLCQHWLFGSGILNNDVARYMAGGMDGKKAVTGPSDQDLVYDFCRNRSTHSVGLHSWQQQRFRSINRSSHLVREYKIKKSYLLLRVLRHFKKGKNIDVSAIWITRFEVQAQ